MKTLELEFTNNIIIKGLPLYFARRFNSKCFSLYLSFNVRVSLSLGLSVFLDLSRSIGSCRRILPFKTCSFNPKCCFFSLSLSLSVCIDLSGLIGSGCRILSKFVQLKMFFSVCRSDSFVYCQPVLSEMFV